MNGSDFNLQSRTPPRATSEPPYADDCAEFCIAAHAALLRQFAETPSMWPRDVARTVAGELPRSRAAALLRELHRRGWTRANARVPMDAMEGIDCPSGVRPPLARLAVFGLPGQGLSSRDKHRQGIYSQLCAQIMSGAVDTASLDAVSRRAMNHPDVAADPVLASMLRSFIAEREAVLRSSRTTPEEEHRRSQEESKVRTGFGMRSPTGFPSREETVQRFGQMVGAFERDLAQFEEDRAQQTLERMRELRRKFPAHVPTAELQHCEEQYDRLLKRAGAYRRQIEELARRGFAAAESGDDQTALWVIRRLDAIHTLLPVLLPEAEFRRLRSEIERGGAMHDSDEASRELLEQQREVARKIKNLAGIVHRFHELAAKLSPTDARYQRAERQYRAAVEEIRQLDTDWLSGLVLQLESFLDDLDDPEGEIQNQLDRFIASVRSALNRLCLEIRAHRRRGGPSKTGRGNGRPDG